MNVFRYPPRLQKSQQARSAVNEFFCRFGYPFAIHTDQGRNFESQLFKSMCDLLQIHKSRTTSYRPAANGQVERFNRTLMNAVRCYIDKAPCQWDTFIPQLAGAIRASVHTSTGFTANRLMLGREVNLPIDMITKATKIDQIQEPNQYISDLDAAIQLAHDVARESMKATQEGMKRDYDVHVYEKRYQMGDKVYLIDKTVTPSKGRKLSPPWKGPGMVIEVITAALYRVRLKNREIVINHDRMKLCRDRDYPRWMKTLETEINEKNPDDTQTKYCICQKPYNFRFMVQYDFCDQWFHGTCIGMTPTQAIRLSQYKCRVCSQ